MMRGRSDNAKETVAVNLSILMITTSNSVPHPDLRKYPRPMKPKKYKLYITFRWTKKNYLCRIPQITKISAQNIQTFCVHKKSTHAFCSYKTDILVFCITERLASPCKPLPPTEFEPRGSGKACCLQCEAMTLCPKNQ